MEEYETYIKYKAFVVQTLVHSYYMSTYTPDKYRIYPELFQDISVFENSFEDIQHFVKTRSKESQKIIVLQEMINELILTAEIKHDTFANINNRTLHQILRKDVGSNTKIHLVIVPSHENDSSITDYINDMEFVRKTIDGWYQKYNKTYIGTYLQKFIKPEGKHILLNLILKLDQNMKNNSLKINSDEIELSPKIQMIADNLQRIEIKIIRVDELMKHNNSNINKIFNEIMD